jgi:hypothetical protein
MEFNDVVRHVILRIVVDQAKLAEDLAKAREKLKGLKDSEKATNAERVKSFDTVKTAVEAQKKALEDNAAAHEAAERARTGKGKSGKAALDDETKAIRANTSATKGQIIEEAKADAVRAEVARKDLDARGKRSAATKKAAADLAAQLVRHQVAERNELLKTDALQSDLADRQSARQATAAANLQALLDKARNLRLGGQTERTLKRVESGVRVAETEAGTVRRDTESSARISRQDTSSSASTVRRDATASAATARQDATVAANTARNDATAAANTARRDAESASNTARRDAESAAGQIRKDADSTAAGIRKDAESTARTATSTARTQGIVDKNEDLKKILDATQVDREIAIRERAASQSVVAQQAAETATLRTEGQKARTGATEAAQATAQIRQQAVEEKRVLDAQRGRIATQRALNALKNDEIKAGQQAETHEKRLVGLEEARIRRLDIIAEREAREAAGEAQRLERERRRYFTRGGSGAAASRLAQDLATAAGRSVITAPVSFITDRRARTTDQGAGAGAGLDGIASRARQATQDSERFFGSFYRGAHRVEAAVGSLASRFRAFVEDINRPRVGGSGGGLGGDIINNFRRMSDAFDNAFSSMARNLFSFRGLIIAVIAALGPLAAILGALGAAALGLASNMVALAGSVLALPGILGAAIAGFGGLALVLKPLSSVFSAYSQAQKDAVKNTTAAKDAALAHGQALLSEQQAQLAYQRSQQDLPRAQRQLTDARRQATRQIEDYRLALQKLKFDEEGAGLGVESAELAYRKSLVDPTKTNLDRRVAAHGLQGAYLDERGQGVAGRRLVEDSREAFRKGVDNADAVISAQRGVEDATYKVRDSYLAWQQAINATNKTAKDAAAGGASAAAYQAELDKLPPKTRAVAKAIIDLKDDYGKLRDRMSENIFGPIARNTGSFKSILDELGSFLLPASQAMGVLAEKALKLFTNPDWKRFFSEQGKENASIISALGDAVLFVADGFRSIVEVARPFTDFVVEGIRGLAEGFRDFATSEDGRENIASFLELTEKRIKEIWPIIKNLAAGFAGFFDALNGSGGGQQDFTTWFNNGLLEASETFRKLGDDARDPNGGFQTWLRDVRPLLHDIVGFLKGAAGFFGELFKNPDNMREARETLKLIAERWLPALADIFDKLSESGLISKLAAGIAGVFDGINDFLDNGGLNALSTFADALETTGQVLSAITSAVDWLTEHVPFLGTVLSGLGILVAAVFGAALIAKFSGLSFALSTVYGFLRGIASVIGSIPWSKIPLIRNITGGTGGTSNKPTGPTPVVPGGGSPVDVDGAGVARNARLDGHLLRIEAYLRQITINTGGLGQTAVYDTPDKESEKDKTRTKPGTPDTETTDKNNKTTTKGRGGWLSRLFNIGGEAAEDAATGAKPGFLGGRVGSLVKGGIIATVLSLAAQEASTLATNQFVKDPADKNSVNNAVGNVATSAGMGGFFGSAIFPGVGTAVGTAAGAGYGLVKSLYQDQNFVDFFDKKLGPFGLSPTASLAGVQTSEQKQKDPGGKNQHNLFKNLFGGAPSEIFAGLDKLDIGAKITGGLDRARSAVSNFFTKTIPQTFNNGVRGIKTFFTETLPGLPKRAIGSIIFNLGRLTVFFTEQLPRDVKHFFTDTVPARARDAWRGIKRNLWDPVKNFVTQDIPGFFTETIPRWFDGAGKTFDRKVIRPVKRFVTQSIPNFFAETIPNWFESLPGIFNRNVKDPFNNFINGIPGFFTETIPKWFESAPKWISTHIKEPLSNFFTQKIPQFFTEDIPNAAKKLPGLLSDKIVKPFTEFFGGLHSHIKLTDLVSGAKDLWDWARNLFHEGEEVQRGTRKMSGGLIEGVYQGIQDTVHVQATPGEFYVRKSKVDQPGVKAFLRDFNEDRINMADLYSGLSASTAPQVMSMVPPNARSMTGAVPTVVNTTVNHAPLMGDVTINNPVREKSDHSLRRQVQIAAMRHRR